MKQSTSGDAVLETLRRFPDLPDAARVRAPVVKALYGGISNATLFRRISAGTIPAPQRDGPRCNSWPVGVLRRHLQGEG